MAVTDWMNNYSITTGSSTTGYLTSTSAYTLPTVTYTTGLPAAIAPPPKGPLAWLDDEIEKTCALAR